MALVPNAVPRERAFRPLIRAVRRVATTVTPCPSCGSSDVRRSLRRSFADFALASLLLAPLRCRKCRVRFFRLWRPAFNKPAELPRAPVIIMPRQLLEIDPVGPYPVEPEPVEPPRTPPLPRLVEPPPAAAKPLRFARPRSVLILESDPSIRKLLRRLLDRRGYFTHEIIEAEDLPAELRERRVDLLIIEASLQREAYGLDAVLALAQAHPNLKILALSAESLNGAEIPGRCVALTKPFSMEAFLECVDRLLESAVSADSEIRP
jgi:CheY-like chemotaxis protein